MCRVTRKRPATGFLAVATYCSTCWKGCILNQITCDWLPTDVMSRINDLQRQMGGEGVERLQSFLKGRVPRQPAQKRAKHVYPGISNGAWRDACETPTLAEMARGLELHHPDIRAEFLEYERSGIPLQDYGGAGVGTSFWRAAATLSKMSPPILGRSSPCR